MYFILELWRTLNSGGYVQKYRYVLAHVRDEEHTYTFFNYFGHVFGLMYIWQVMYILVSDWTCILFWPSHLFYWRWIIVVDELWLGICIVIYCSIIISSRPRGRGFQGVTISYNTSHTSYNTSHTSISNNYHSSSNNSIWLQYTSYHF